MNLPDKNGLYLGVLVCLSMLLFLIRLHICQYVPPGFGGMDYYEYIELGKNIFHKLDFTVRWELDTPILYPPLYPILVYLLTCLTKNFVVSMQYINTWCASFYIIPIFFLTQRMLNTYSAILAVVFTICYLSLAPVYGLWTDYFNCLLIMSICWAIAQLLVNNSREVGKYFFVGLLIGVAYITKYSALLFCCAGVASILYYFARHERDLKTGLRMSGSLLLGLAPFFIGYHLLIHHTVRGQIASDSAYTFFDGNYLYEGGQAYRDMKLARLNKEGTEFAHIDLLKTENEFKFFMEKPEFVLKKYIWGLKRLAMSVSFAVLPLDKNMKAGTSVIFQWTFLFFLVVSGIYFKWHFKLMQVFFFAVGMAFVPLFFSSARYLMPFMPFYFMLWLFILNAGYHWADSVIKNKLFLKGSAALAFAVLVLIYGINGFQEVRLSYQYKTKVKADELSEQAASWIKNDAKSFSQRPKIMAKNNYPAYLTDSDFILLPAELNWERIIKFAALKKVNYIIVDGGFLNDPGFSPREFRTPMTPEGLMRAISAGKVIHVRGVSAPIDILNKFLQYENLYKFMPIWPQGSKDIIDRIEQGHPVTLLELRQLNRLLIETNYPLQAPNRQWVNQIRLMVHEVQMNKELVYILKIS